MENKSDSQQQSVETENQLPLFNTTNIMREVIKENGENIRISKDAQQFMVELASEFVLFLASEFVSFLSLYFLFFSFLFLKVMINIFHLLYFSVFSFHNEVSFVILK